jgi:siroheme synthase-like protein
MKSTGRPPVYYPLFLNIAGRRCVVVGGGQVALRKVEMLLEFGAEVLAISPEFCPELEEMARDGCVTLLGRSYQAGDLRDARVAVAATDDNETNQAVVREARERGALVNVVDDAAASDFIVPSYVHRGDVTVAVSTAGRSPALARKLRTRLEEQFGPEYATLALLLGEVRAEVRKQGIRVSGDAWQEALDLDRILRMVQDGDIERARETVLEGLMARRTG